MILVRRSDVPEYLRSSTFYHSLDGTEDEDEIEVPSRTLKPDVDVKNCDDLEHLLTTLRFWGSNDIPEQIIHYMITTGSSRLQEIASEFQYSLTFINTVVEIIDAQNMPEKLGIAMSSGVVQIVSYLVDHGCVIYPHSIERACMTGKLDCLKFVQLRGVALHREALAVSVQHNQLACVQYLHIECGLELLVKDAEIAARCGHLKMRSISSRRDAPRQLRSPVQRLLLGIWTVSNICMRASVRGMGGPRKPLRPGATWSAWSMPGSGHARLLATSVRKQRAAEAYRVCSWCTRLARCTFRWKRSPPSMSAGKRARKTRSPTPFPKR